LWKESEDWSPIQNGMSLGPTGLLNLAGSAEGMLLSEMHEWFHSRYCRRKPGTQQFDRQSRAEVTVKSRSAARAEAIVKLLSWRAKLGACIKVFTTPHT
jgi:hypothetical protein